MKLWVPLVLGGVILGAYAFFYELTGIEAQGAAAMGFANAAGLALVFFGIIAAGLILRRASPPQ